MLPRVGTHENATLHFFSGGPLGVGYVIPSSANGLAWIVIPVISGGSMGVDLPLTGRRSHLSNVSQPSRTCPKTVCILFKCGCCSYKMKNCDFISTCLSTKFVCDDMTWHKMAQVQDR